VWKLVQGSISKIYNLVTNSLSTIWVLHIFKRKSENIQYQINDSDVDDLIINFDVWFNGRLSWEQSLISLLFHWVIKIFFLKKRIILYRNNLMVKTSNIFKFIIMLVCYHLFSKILEIFLTQSNLISKGGCLILRDLQLKSINKTITRIGKTCHTIFFT
jgi:hypothetical protein